MTTGPTRLAPRAKFAVLLPLAVVSAACTIELCTAPGGSHPSVLTLSAAASVPVAGATPAAPVAGPGSTPIVPPIEQPPVRLPNSTFAAPAAGGIAPALFTDSTSDIPAVALAAYQRAATVMDAADATCHLPWQLLAAIGRVESDHGQAQGNTLGANGIDTPGIYGPVLNGKNGTAAVADTDGGAVDGNATYDRAVGPMQFLPSTWSMVAVDADGDGKRDPQDVNDAALGAAAYLCANNADLSTAAAQRQAVFRYNHSWSYVRTVIGLATSYISGVGTPLDVSDVPAVYGASSGTDPAAPVETDRSTGSRATGSHAKGSHRRGSPSKVHAREGVNHTASPAPTTGNGKGTTKRAKKPVPKPDPILALCTAAVGTYYPHPTSTDAVPTAAAQCEADLKKAAVTTVSGAQAALKPGSTELTTEMGSLQSTPGIGVEVVPSSDPSPDPTGTPSGAPTTSPSTDPTTGPTTSPTTDPASGATTDPSTDPGADPSADANADPSSTGVSPTPTASGSASTP